MNKLGLFDCVRSASGCEPYWRGALRLFTAHRRAWVKPASVFAGLIVILAGLLWVGKGNEAYIHVSSALAFCEGLAFLFFFLKQGACGPLAQWGRAGCVGAVHALLKLTLVFLPLGALAIFLINTDTYIPAGLYVHGEMPPAVTFAQSVGGALFLAAYFIARTGFFLILALSALGDRSAFRTAASFARAHWGLILWSSFVLYCFFTLPLEGLSFLLYTAGKTVLANLSREGADMVFAVWFVFSEICKVAIESIFAALICVMACRIVTSKNSVSTPL